MDAAPPRRLSRQLRVYDAVRLLLRCGADFNACNVNFNFKIAEDLARFHPGSSGRRKDAALLRDVRCAGGWLGYVRTPRKRLVALRILAEQGRAETKDTRLVRLFPAGPPASEGTKRPREAYRAQKGGRIPRGIFMHIVGYWRSSRDYLGPTSAGGTGE